MKIKFNNILPNGGADPTINLREILNERATMKSEVLISDVSREGSTQSTEFKQQTWSDRYSFFHITDMRSNSKSKVGTKAHMLFHLVNRMLLLTANFVGMKERM